MPANESPEPFREEAESALSILAHRGPDAAGLWWDDRVLLGHRRLAVVDLSDAGTQPLHDHENNLHISFNGEIYNYRKLKKDLEARGYRFRTGTDTETLLGAYLHYGDDFIEKLMGMFAFVLYDRKRGKVLLCRDRLGKKPLYFSMNGGRLIAASELKAFYAFGDIAPSIDMESLRSYFSLQYIPGPWTILKEVRRVQPGCCMTLDLRRGGIFHRRYWTPTASATSGVGTPEDMAEAVASLFAESVERRLVADVDIGLMLSGGVDSSLIACLASELSGKPLKGFVVSFEGDLDESVHAETVASALDMELVKVEGESPDPDTFERMVYHADEPLGDSACIPTFMISKAMSSHVKVILSGEGADELFWGYTHYRREILLKRLFPGPFPSPASRRLRKRAAQIENRSGACEPFPRLCKLLESGIDIGVARWTTIFGETAADGLFTRECFEPFRPPRFALEMHEALVSGEQFLDPTAASIAVDVSFFLPDDLLVKVDRMSMAHGIEARTPFLDHKLVEHALGMPGGQKADLLETKKILRTLLARRLPAKVAASIAYRKKHGFDVPLHRWLKSDLRSVAESCFSASALRETGFLDASRIETLWKGFLRRPTSVPYARKIWTILCFLAWHRRHAGGFRI